MVCLRGRLEEGMQGPCLFGATPENVVFYVIQEMPSSGRYSDPKSWASLMHQQVRLTGELKFRSFDRSKAGPLDQVPPDYYYFVLQSASIERVESKSAADVSEKTSLRKRWSSPDYTTNSLPAVWRPNNIPATASDVSEFERFTLKTESLSIPKFIGRYGLPSRYLVTQRKKGQDFLIYDLPSGHAVALYVPKLPADTFAACVIITSDGGLVKLIK